MVQRFDSGMNAVGSWVWPFQVRSRLTPIEEHVPVGQTRGPNIALLAQIL
jgi:hypothetical protein